MDLGEGGHRRARIARGRLLANRHGRRQSRHAVEPRVPVLLHEAPRVGGEAAGEPPLALREDGVEGQRGLAASGHARDHRHPVPGDLHVDVLEVVRGDAGEPDRRRRIGPPSTAHGVGALDAGVLAERRAIGRQDAPQGRAGQRPLRRGDLFRRAGGDHRSAPAPAAGTEVDHPVRGFDDVEVMLDDDRGVAALDEAVDGREQQHDVRRMQAGRGFVEDVQRPARAWPRQLRREFHPLRLSPGEHGRRMADAEVAEAECVERSERAGNRRLVREERERVGDGHLEHVVNRRAAVPHRQRRVVEPAAVARLARHRHRAEELHPDLPDSRAFAGFAAAAADVEREAALAEAQADRLRFRGEQIAHAVEQRRCRSRGSSAVSARSAPGRSR